MMQRRYKYHIFLSHNGAQKEWTRRLADRLRQEGLSIFFDEDSIKLGEDIPAAIETGLKSSRHVVLVLSPEALKSKWVVLEYSASLYKDPNDADRTLIPVLRKDCDIPLILARLKYLDVRSDDFERQVEHLLNGIERVEVQQPSQAPTERKTGGPAPDIGQRLTVTTPVPLGALYVERAADLEVRRAIETNQLVVVFGPRKSGKTSLAYRACAFAESIGRPVAFINFQMFPGGSSLPQLYYSVATLLSREVGGKKPEAEKFLLTPGTALQECFSQLPANTVIAFDDFDALRGINALEAFSQMLRALWSHCAVDASQRISILISSWLPPFRFIESSLVSPFNIGRQVRLENFNRTEAEHLIRQVYPSLSAKDADSLYDLVDGQPWLLQQALYKLAEVPSAKELLQNAITIFSSYLEFLKVTLGAETRRCLLEQGLDNLALALLGELESVGLIRKKNRRYEYVCRLYEMAFSQHHDD